jgi:drug/metabolite transporter (DMT)-like permease
VKPVTNYKLGAVYSLATALLLSIQAPFSALAARSLTSPEFICLTQLALLFSVPLLTVSRAGRRDFAAVLFNVRNWGKLAILFAVGITGLVLYNIGLSSAHPFVTAGVLNLSPFWAALVAMAVSRKSLPGSPALFFCCFAVAFVGAMAIAWSQLSGTSANRLQDIVNSILHSRWIYALPMPIFFALSGTLVGKWFRGLEESGVMAANFVVSAIILIPLTIAIAYPEDHFRVPGASSTAVLMLLVGTLASSAAGRVFYQVALTTTDNDNGYVTMFFLVIPVVSYVISILLSQWISDLHVIEGPVFLLGLILVTAPLLVFSIKTLRSAGPLHRDLAATERSPSEPHADARGRIDVLDVQNAVREAAVPVRSHHAGVNVDALHWSPVRKEGDGVLTADAHQRLRQGLHRRQPRQV